MKTVVCFGLSKEAYNMYLCYVGKICMKSKTALLFLSLSSCLFCALLTILSLCKQTRTQTSEFSFCTLSLALRNEGLSVFVH